MINEVIAKVRPLPFTNYKRREQGTGNREQGANKKHSFAPV
jgi:hypothetical protein